MRTIIRALIALLLPFASHAAIDAVLVGKGVAAAGTSVTTTAGTTTTGSTFAIACHFDGVRDVSTVADSFTNTYTQAGTKSANGNGGAALYYCQNCTGGASHTATVTFSAAAFQVCYLIEITGAATASYDTQTQGTDSATPYELASPTTAQADSILISVFGHNHSGTVAHASSNSTIIGEEQNGSTYYGGAVSKLVRSTTSPITISFTRAGATTATGALKIAAFKQAAGGGGSTVVNPISGKGGAAAVPVIH